MVDKYQKLLADCKNKDQEIIILKNQSNSSKNNEKYLVEITSLQSKIKEIKAAWKDDADRLTKTIQQLKVNNNELTSKNQQLTTDWNSLLAKYDASQEQIKSLQSQLNQLQAQVQQSKHKNGFVHFFKSIFHHGSN